MYSPLIGHPLCAREVLYLHVFILSFLFLENYAIRSLFYPNTIYTLPPGCSQVRGQSMMLTQPVKSGMLLAHSPPRPHPGSLSAQRNCGGWGEGSHHTPGVRAALLARQPPSSGSLRHNRSVGTTRTRQGMRATTKEAAPTGLPGLEGPELRASLQDHAPLTVRPGHDIRVGSLCRVDSRT